MPRMIRAAGPEFVKTTFCHDTAVGIVGCAYTKSRKLICNPCVQITSVILGRASLADQVLEWALVHYPVHAPFYTAEC